MLPAEETCHLLIYLTLCELCVFICVLCVQFPFPKLKPSIPPAVADLGVVAVGV